MPALATLPPEASGGLARVIIDTDVPAQVTRTTKGGVGGRGATLDDLLCAETPCAVTLPYGDHLLAFVGLADQARRSAVIVKVRKPTEIVNHSLGEYSSNAVAETGEILICLGIFAVLVGGALAKAAPSAAGRTALGGLGGIVAGGLFMAAMPATYREPSTTQWSPESDGRTVGAAIGVGF